MIVRIMGEGQAELADSHIAELSSLDDELLAEMERGDGPGFRATLHALLDKVRELGTPLPDDSLEPSDPAVARRHPGRGACHAQRRRADPRLTTVPLRSVHRSVRHVGRTDRTAGDTPYRCLT